jgi:subtilisin family serine protease
MCPTSNIKVALIDSGINVNEFNVIDNVVFRIDDVDNIKECNNVTPINNHGTLVAHCINTICNNIEFIDINIVDNSGLSYGDLLIKALEYCKFVDVDIINLSLGTTKFRYVFRMHKIIRELNKKGTIIVAAENNANKKAYPANMNHVIGVKGDSFITSYNNYYYKNKFYYAYNKLHPNFGNNENDIYGNSLACGFITGHICKELLSKKIRGEKNGK